MHTTCELHVHCYEDTWLTRYLYMVYAKYTKGIYHSPTTDTLAPAFPNHSKQIECFLFAGVHTLMKAWS